MAPQYIPSWSEVAGLSKTGGSLGSTWPRLLGALKSLARGSQRAPRRISSCLRKFSTWATASVQASRRCPIACTDLVGGTMGTSMRGMRRNKVKGEAQASMARWNVADRATLLSSIRAPMRSAGLDLDLPGETSAKGSNSTILSASIIRPLLPHPDQNDTKNVEANKGVAALSATPCVDPKPRASRLVVSSIRAETTFAAARTGVRAVG